MIWPGTALNLRLPLERENSSSLCPGYDPRMAMLTVRGTRFNDVEFRIALWADLFSWSGGLILECLEVQTDEAELPGNSPY